MNDIQKLAEKLKEEAGGVWENPDGYDVEDWRSEVINNYTRIGLWEWIAHQEDLK